MTARAPVMMDGGKGQGVATSAWLSESLRSFLCISLQTRVSLLSGVLARCLLTDLSRIEAHLGSSAGSPSRPRLPVVWFLCSLA